MEKANMCKTPKVMDISNKAVTTVMPNAKNKASIPRFKLLLDRLQEIPQSMKNRQNIIG